MFRFTNLIIFRLTRDCNLNCKYCFMQNKSDFKGEVIDFEVYKNIIQKIIHQRLVNNAQMNELTIVFHGGELLLLGEDKLHDVFSYAKSEFEKNNCNFKFGCQTNATLITDSIAKILADFNVSVGLSFDGIDGSNNSRTNIKQTTFENKFNILKNNKVSFGILIVASKTNIHNISKTKKYLKKIIGGFKINYAEDMINPGPNSEIEISGKEMFESVYLEEFEEFFRSGSLNEFHFKDLLEKSLIDILTIYELTAESGCDNKFCGAGIKMIAIEPDGEMDYCDRYSKKFDEAYIQNALDYDFLGLHQLNKVIQYNKMKSKIYREYGCDTCRADYICNHGCESFYYSKYHKYGIETRIVCDQYKMFYDYTLKNLKKILKTFLKFNKEILAKDRIISLNKFALDLCVEMNIKMSIVNGKIKMEKIDGNK